MSQMLMSFTSHIAGKNARVRLFEDRIEWDRNGSWAGPIIVAVFTAAISLLFYRPKRSTEMMLLRSVSGVSTSPSLTQSEVLVSGSGMMLAFRCSKGEAEEFKGRVLALMGQPAPQVVVQHTPVQHPQQAGPDVAQQLQQLAGLRDQGILSTEEFETKKRELLSRM